MDRRAFVRALGLGMLARPIVVASQPVRGATVGYLAAAPGGVSLVLTGNTQVGPYQIQAIVPSAVVFDHIEWGVNGSYWATTTVEPHYFFRSNDPIGEDILFKPLGAGPYQIEAVVKNGGTTVGTATLAFTEGAITPPPTSVQSLFPANAVWNTPVDTAPIHPMHGLWM